jgi:NAD(P)-dependent dehydrogenase (short-subunit alcohol dehydrogenase family)
VKDFRDRVAMVTGAGSGIGRALAERCAREGMGIVLADVEEPALADVAGELEAAGAPVLAVRTDVSREADVKALARKTLDAFGAVHLLFNNAGVIAGSTAWESTLADWEWVLGVNLWGVIHGLRVFVPVMLAQDTEGHIVDTASIAGFARRNPFAPYQVSKHAVVALTEHLYYSLAERNATIKTSVLCPAGVSTRIMDAERNRPPELLNAPGEELLDPEWQARIGDFRQAVQAGTPPDQIADQVFRAIRAEQFYILTHPEENALIQGRMEDILHGRNPEL